MNPIEIATIGANLERDFQKYEKLPPEAQKTIHYTIPVHKNGETVMEPRTKTLRFLGRKCIQVASGENKAKAIVFMDEDNNVYFHFNGTGDGAWGYNSANYGSLPSSVQTESLAFFEENIDMLSKQLLEENKTIGNVYLTGHSQGGNTAQYVLINSKYADYVDTCVSLDGPGLSEHAVKYAKYLHGEGYFERQRQKIYGVFGELDYVHPLGQVQIIPEDHVTFVENTGGDPHAVSGMMQGTSLNAIINKVPAMHKFITGLNEKLLKTLGPIDQKNCADLVMKLVEAVLKENYIPEFSDEEMRRLGVLLVPILLEYLKENMALFRELLNDFSSENGGPFPPEAVTLIAEFVDNLNELPQNQREAVLLMIVEGLVIKKDGSIGLGGSLFEILCDISAVISLTPTILETLLTNPSEGLALLDRLNVTTLITDYIKEHPVASVLIVAGAIAFRKVIGVVVLAVIISGVVLEFIYTVAEALENIGKEVKEFLLNTLTAIKIYCEKIRDFIYSRLPSTQYSEDNPYFRADTARLRDYAGRLNRVNTRLRNLDDDLNDLYWQVKLADMKDILAANIITSYSWRIRSSRDFLNDAADILEEAERQALQCMGG